MPTLTIEDIDEQIVNALENQAKQHGTTPEIEHKRILETALKNPIQQSFAEVLANMPNVGQDSDFERFDDTRNHNVFDWYQYYQWKQKRIKSEYWRPKIFWHFKSKQPTSFQ